MPPVEGPPPEEKKNVVGFIYPPPEVRSILLGHNLMMSCLPSKRGSSLVVVVQVFSVMQSFFVCSHSVQCDYGNVTGVYMVAGGGSTCHMAAGRMDVPRPSPAMGKSADRRLQTD